MLGHFVLDLREVPRPPHFPPRATVFPAVARGGIRAQQWRRFQCLLSVAFPAQMRRWWLQRDRLRRPLLRRRLAVSVPRRGPRGKTCRRPRVCTVADGAIV